MANPLSTSILHEFIEFTAYFQSFSRISGSVLDNGNSYTSGRHASLLATGSRTMHQEATQLREGLLTGTLTGQKINYLDSGYSEEDADQQVTSCLMKTSSGSIYIPPSKSFIKVSEPALFIIFFS